MIPRKANAEKIEFIDVISSAININVNKSPTPPLAISSEFN